MSVLRLDTASGPLHCEIAVPGSKSIANRALICAALAGAGSRVANVPDGDDTVAMLDALRVLGVAVSPDEGGVSFTSALDCENAEEVIKNLTLKIQIITLLNILKL